MKTISKNQEERLELFDKKIKEKFGEKEEFFKNFRYKERTFKKKIIEGKTNYLDIHKTEDLLDITREELIFIFFGQTIEEQKKYLISEEMMKGQSQEVIEFLKHTNEILKDKSIKGRKIFLNELQKTIELDLKKEND